MKRYFSVHLFALGACLALTAACGSSGAGSVNAAAPSAAAAASSVNLSGSWAGKLASVQSNSGDPNAPSVKWSATQSGSSVTGPLSLTFSDDAGRPQTIQGTLNGAMSGGQLSLTLSFPAGAFADIPGCTVGGAGTATPTSSSISSTVAITFSAPCVGTVTDRPTETDQLTLTKS